MHRVHYLAMKYDGQAHPRVVRVPQPRVGYLYAGSLGQEDDGGFILFSEQAFIPVGI